jgi:hypothetical protein
MRSCSLDLPGTLERTSIRLGSETLSPLDFTWSMAELITPLHGGADLV